MSIPFLPAFYLIISIVFSAFKLLGTSRYSLSYQHHLSSKFTSFASNSTTNQFINWLLLSTVHSTTLAFNTCHLYYLPFNSHFYLLPLLSQCLLLLDEICRRSLHFIKVCIYYASSLVRAVTNYGIQYGRHNLLLGHNLLFCARL